MGDSSNTLLLTIQQAEALVHAHFPKHASSKVALMTEVPNQSYSFTSSNKVYLLDIDSSHDFPSKPRCTVFIVIEAAAAGAPRPGGPEHQTNDYHTNDYHTNDLATVQDILSRICKGTRIPIAEPVLDSTRAHAPHTCLITQPLPCAAASIISLASARARGLIPAQAAARVELQLGQYLGQLHSGVQNDWFGLARAQGSAPADPSYSWQETFTHLLEALLAECHVATATAAGAAAAAGGGLELELLPYEDIRRYLSRAIGFFLFDDVEVPSLVWFTGSEHDIYLSVASPTDLSVVAILPNVSHALWGDPLLESFFLPPAPSSNFLEAYTASGGGNLLVFTRQKTKRMWYSLFLALVVLRENGWRHASKEMEGVMNLLRQSVSILEHAPCY